MKKKVLLVSLVVLGSFLVLIRTSKAYTCHLGFSSPQSSTGNVIYIGSSGTWTLTSDVSSGTSYWFGTKNGYTDVSNSSAGGTHFSWTTDTYSSGMVGFYTRYIQIYDDSDQLACTTNTVVTQVISAATPTPTPTLTPTPTPTGVPTLSFVSGGRVGERPTYQVIGLSGYSATLTLDYWGPNTSNCYYGCSERSFSVSVSGGVATFTGGNAWGTNDVGGWTARITDVTNSTSRTSATISFTVASAPTSTTTPTVTVLPSSLNFTATVGGNASPASQTLTITYSAGANWGVLMPSNSLWLRASSGGQQSSPQTLIVSADPLGLSAGTYSGTITISGNFTSSPKTILVTLTVSTTPPTSRATDSDNSPDYTYGISNPITPSSNPDLFMKGVGSGNYVGAAGEAYTTLEDYCASPTQLNEAFVNSSGKLSAYGAIAPSGYICSNGKFVITQTSTPTIIAIVPGGTAFTKGETYWSTWSGQNTPATGYGVYLVGYNGSRTHVASLTLSGQPTGGTFSWKVPSDITAGSYQLLFNYAGTDLANSPTFQIVNATSTTPPSTAITETSINGPVYGATGVNHDYTFYARSNTTDSTLIYKVNWGDEMVTQELGPNGYPKHFSHQWSEGNSYTITFTATLPNNPQVYRTTTLNVSMGSSATTTPGVLTLSFVSGSRAGERPTYRATGLSGSSATLKFDYSGPNTSNCYYVASFGGFGCSETFNVSVSGGVATFTGGNAWLERDVGRWSARITNTSNQVMSATTYFDVVSATSPTPTPTATLTPTPTPVITPITPLPPVVQNRLYSLSEIYDGDLIRGQGDIAVWIVKIVGEKRFKRWLFGPQIFSAYRHLGFNKVKNVSKETVNRFDTSNLIRKFDDTKVYELTDFTPGVSATRRWIQTAETFLQRGFDFDSVYTVNQREYNMYTEGTPLPITKADEIKSNLPLTANLSEAMKRFLGW